MNKKAFLITILAAIMLTSCSCSNNIIQKQMLEKSGILENSNYLEYEKLVDEGKIDSEGYFAEEQAEVSGELPQVSVSFAKNNHLDIVYYSGETNSIKLDTTNCHLNPGESIYAVVTNNKIVSSSMYDFSEFRVYEYEDDEKILSQLAFEESAEGYCLRIPDDYKGTSISIEPLGYYHQRTINLYDYYVDDDGIQHPLEGTWIVNDQEITGDSCEINPTLPYIVSYKYDTNEYFYLSSDPASFYIDNYEGVVVFNQRNPEDENVDYSVALHKYVTVTLIADESRNVDIKYDKNEEDEYVHYNKDEEIILGDHLKFGDRIILKTNKKWDALENVQEIIVSNEEDLLGGKYQYTLNIPEKGGEFEFNPKDYSYEHGSIIFKCHGKVVNSTLILAKGTKIEYDESSVEKGYWLAGNKKEHVIEVGDNESTIAALKAIHFTKKVPVTVNLVQPGFGGKIEYKMNGKMLLGDTVSAYSGDVITMEFKAWNGWLVNEIIKTNGSTLLYSVNETGEQDVTFKSTSNEKLNIDELFSEADNHKPELSIKLEKSFGKLLSFMLLSPNTTNGDIKYKQDNIKNFKNVKIGTEKAIKIGLYDSSIVDGTAVKITIVKTDSNGNKSTEIRLLDDINKDIAPIDIYDSSEIATSTITYKTVDISLGVVKAQHYKQHASSDNTSIRVTHNVTGNNLSPDDLVDTNDKISLTIVPMPGYYLEGKDVAKDNYEKVMKYSDYLKNIDDIVSKYTAKKYYVVTLSQPDSFAKYDYKLDGKSVFGTVKVKEGQKLELSYEIVKPDYVLNESHGGLFGIGASNTKATESIIMSSSFDGKTITNYDFYIESRKAG